MLDLENMYNRFKDRPLSHSQLASFEYDKEQWYQSYILGLRSPATPNMLAGSRIGDSIGADNNEVPDLNPPGVKEYAIKGEVDGIYMIGYADHYCPDTLVLNENKTSTTKYRWNQKKTDEHPQLTMYALLLQIQDKVKPEDITMWLNFIPLELKGVDLKPTGKVKSYETRRTQEQVKEYVKQMKQTIEEMESYAQWRLAQDKQRVSIKGTTRLL